LSAALNLAARRLRQFLALAGITMQEVIVYKAQAYIWLFTDVLTALVMPFVWLSAGGNEFGGYPISQLILYYVVLVMVSSFVTSHFMWEIGTEIREGIFSTHLLRPVSYAKFAIARNLGYRLVRTVLVLPFLVLLIAVLSRHVNYGDLYLGWGAWACLIMGHLVSVMFVLAMSMIALFTEEAETIFELYYFPMIFLSGQIVPVSLFPDWVQSIAQVLPFYYTTAAPTEVLVGRHDSSATVSILIGQAAWIGISYVAYLFLQRAGRKHYAGVGM
jgi:ABC-2 type transport system permease protein